MSGNIKKTLVGLTGGIACGKSEALKIFGQLGWETISTDEIVRNLLSSDKGLISVLTQRWGEVVLEKEEINKKRISQIIFSNEQERKWLENLLHPKVRAIWKEKFELSEKDKVIVEIPLLFEKDLGNLFESIICVTCEEKKQFQRLKDRGLTKLQSSVRIKVQLPLLTKVRLADTVLLGESSVMFLRKQVEVFHSRYT